MSEVAMTHDQEEAIRSTVPGSTWYYSFGGRWYQKIVARVTKTLVIFEDGSRVSKGSLVTRRGQMCFPPTPDMVKVFEAQGLKDVAQWRKS